MKVLSNTLGMTIRATLSAFLLTAAAFSLLAPSDIVTAASDPSGTAIPKLKAWGLQNSSSSEPGTSGVSKVPDPLETFVEQTVSDLAGHLPFKSWQDASLDYTPLGPGTHSWLVTVADGAKPLGYLIISADDLGGYMLSEYGIGSELPYSLAPLENTLAASGVLKQQQHSGKPEFSPLPKGSRVEALYSPVSPYWKVTLNGKAPVYIHAVTYDIIPSPGSSTAPSSTGTTSIKRQTLNSFGAWTAATVINTEGEQDPYRNLTWLTKPALSIKNESDLTRLLPADSRKSLVFTTTKQNAAFGAPFTLTGWQLWSPNNKLEPEIVYVRVPQRNTDLIRFVPASHLIGPGKFREEPNA